MRERATLHPPAVEEQRRRPEKWPASGQKRPAMAIGRLAGFAVARRTHTHLRRGPRWPVASWPRARQLGGGHAGDGGRGQRPWRWEVALRNPEDQACQRGYSAQPEMPRGSLTTSAGGGSPAMTARW
jgi:hypothetical protein